MKSTDIKELSAWEQWPRSALAKAPETPGVYIFRLSTCFGRMQGVSDITYIGLAKRNLRKRLELHQRTAIGLFARFHGEVGTLQVAWKSCREQSETTVMECRFLLRHRRDHMELPPLNRQQPFKVLEQYFKAMSQLGNVQNDDQLEERALAAFRQLEERVLACTKPSP